LPKNLTSTPNQDLDGFKSLPLVQTDMDFDIQKEASGFSKPGTMLISDAKQTKFSGFFW